MAAEPAACVDLSPEMIVAPETGVRYRALAYYGGGGVLLMLAQGAIQEALRLPFLVNDVCPDYEATGAVFVCSLVKGSYFYKVRVSYAYLYNYTKIPIANPRKHVQQLEHV
jgi:hypothetical protein